MRFGTIFALLFSVVIVGLALWWRFSDIKPGAPVIYSVEDQGQDDYEAALEFFTEPKAPQATTTKPAELKPLTDTDIISRNMLLSYMGTAIGNTDVKDEDIEKIAEFYLDEATGLHKFEKIGAESIKMISDNETNATNYARAFANIYAMHADRMTVIHTNISAVISEENAYTPFVEPVAAVYSEIATALRALPVPVSLSLLHLELINIYLSNAAALREAKEINNEPMTAMSGLMAIKENGTRELALLEELRTVFISKWGEIQ